MMTVNGLRRLFDHVFWANTRVLEAFRGLERVPSKPLELFAHVLAAEHVWLSRMNGVDPQLPVWPKLDADECERTMLANREGYVQLLGAMTEDGTKRIVSYRNSQGSEFETSAVDILTHVALHGSYHRGQIAMLIRLDGLDPVSTDFILFVRE